MRGKLIKHAFRSNAAAAGGSYAALGAIGLLMAVLMLIDWSAMGDRGPGVGLLVKAIAAGGLVLTALVCLVLTCVAVFGDFNRSMYGAEGQLTLTLPVRSSSLLFAKWFAGTFWIVLSYFALCLCFFGSTVYLLQHAMNMFGVNATYYSAYTLSTEAVSTLFAAVGKTAPDINVLLNQLSVYAFAVGVMFSVVVIVVYFSITLSKCRPFQKFGKGGGAVYSVLSLLLLLLITRALKGLFNVYVVFSDKQYTFALLNEADLAAISANGYGYMAVMGVYTSLMLGVGVFLLTTYLIDRKVNVNT